jgi:hypothetical protein
MNDGTAIPIPPTTQPAGNPGERIAGGTILAR